jgi:hypothetical protein
MSALSGVPRFSAEQLATRPKWTVAKLILSQRQSGRLLLYSRISDINSKQVVRIIPQPPPQNNINIKIFSCATLYHNPIQI